jgi:acyl-CoA reductase-like NAD-dependent aldehyde dehydrogenase
MLKESYPYYLANRPVAANTDLEVTNKYTGEVATRVARADAEAIDRAIGKAVEAFATFGSWPAHRRRAVLAHVVQRIEERHEELSRALAVEAGKPIGDARGEVTRSLDTFRLAAEESTRIYGEYLPLDISPRAEGYEGVWKRVPVGPCSFISPFNFPLNLSAHKIAPALAAGCPFLLKPASSTPVSALVLGEILSETDLPEGTFSILPVSREGADLFTTDERLKLLSFTGSPEVGWDLKARAGKKKVILELGGNAACIVDRDADLDLASERLVKGIFYQSGQSCISVQRVLIHEEVYGDLAGRLVEKAQALVAGDPLDENTFLGPLITEEDARRVEEWVGEAVDRGARVLVGGEREGPFYAATLLENAPRDARVSCREVFGPVATLERFSDFGEALRIADDSEYGLQAGVFTRDIHHALRAWDSIEVGCVVVNDIPSMRVDSMPYGGVKTSGHGREGIRFAIEDMTEIRLLLLHRTDWG